MNNIYVVTGGGSGIGAQVATSLVAQGSQVYILGRRKERCRRNLGD
mgnify:CR=1 FL=1